MPKRPSTTRYEIATDPGFKNIIKSGDISDPTPYNPLPTNLPADTVLYSRSFTSYVDPTFSTGITDDER